MLSGRAHKVQGCQQLICLMSRSPLQVPKKWNTKPGSGTRIASAAASARRPLAPSRLYRASRRSTVPAATRRSLPRAASSATRWGYYKKECSSWVCSTWRCPEDIYKSICPLTSCSIAGNHLGWRDLQERAVASWVLHLHPLQHHAGRAALHQPRREALLCRMLRRIVCQALHIVREAHYG